MDGTIYRGRRSLFYQFPRFQVFRNTQTGLFEKVIVYGTRDPDDPQREPPDPPERRRAIAALTQYAARFAGCRPVLDEYLVDAVELVAPMSAETAPFPPTFLCTRCGRVNHVSERGTCPTPPWKVLEALREANGGNLWSCRCGGRMVQWHFRTIHPVGREEATFDSPLVTCRVHGATALRLHNTRAPELGKWIVTCEASGCAHRRVGVRGRFPSAEDTEGLPERFKMIFRTRPAGATTNMVPRILTLPFATADLKPPPLGTPEAEALVAEASGRAGVRAPPSWRQRPREEVDLIFEFVREGKADTPEAAESILLSYGELRPQPRADGGADPRSLSESALEQAQIIKRARAGGRELPAHGPLARVTAHGSMPLCTLLVGYTYNSMDPRECVLRLYTRQRDGRAPAPVVYYHTGDVEALLLEFRAPEGGALPHERLHSWTHAIIRALGEHGGYGESSIAEYLLPDFGAALLYPTESAEVVLGLLEAAWAAAGKVIVERAGEILLTCPGDPYCESGAGACGQCIMLPVHSCQAFNARLDRRAAQPTSTGP